VKRTMQALVGGGHIVAAQHYWCLHIRSTELIVRLCEVVQVMPIQLRDLIYGTHGSPHTEVALALLELAGSGTPLQCPAYKHVRLLDPAHIAEVRAMLCVSGKCCYNTLVVLCILLCALLSGRTCFAHASRVAQTTATPCCTPESLLTVGTEPGDSKKPTELVAGRLGCDGDGGVCRRRPQAVGAGHSLPHPPGPHPGTP
jgi:hypothetical protein